MRDVVLEVPASPVGQRTATGDGAVMRFGFASGQTMEPRPGEGWIQLDAGGPARIAGPTRRRWCRGA
ncbi:MAG: hypothetical protein IPF99_03080 [Deltaproteobacteria bacterium]|nr:hypothetical protein [Deltaproteobacteria bacterium]